VDYAASKAAAVAIATGLRGELRRMKSNVNVTIVCPGFMKVCFIDFIVDLILLFFFSLIFFVDFFNSQ
jgi:short-subunit dehydrogenase